MRISSQRLPAVIAITSAVALVVAVIVRNAKHGFALYLGDAAWAVFLIGVLVSAVVVVVMLAKLARNRRSTRPTAR
jgi:hypothetical protein